MYSDPNFLLKTPSAKIRKNLGFNKIEVFYDSAGLPYIRGIK